MHLRRPDEMADPALASDTPSERAGGTNGDGAGGPGSGTPRGPRLRLEIREPFLRLIASMRAALDPAADRGAAAEEVEKASAAVASTNKGRRQLRRAGVLAIQFGQHKITRTDETDIVAKFQYKKPKKIVCQMRQGDALVKIHILWSNIQAMSACFDDARFDTLKIQVKSSCEQYNASPPTPGMHLQWQRCADVIPRTFSLQFEKGELERGYDKMLYTDPSLFLLPALPPDQEDAGQPTNTQRITTAFPVPTIRPSRDGLNKRKRS